MSADNWAICPRCQRKAGQEREAKLQVVVEAYGKVPAAEYERMRSEVADLPEFGDTDEDHTLREDYEFGINSHGAFYAIYKAVCKACGFDHKFQHDAQLSIEDE